MTSDHAFSLAGGWFLVSHYRTGLGRLGYGTSIKQSLNTQTLSFTLSKYRYIAVTDWSGLSNPNLSWLVGIEYRYLGVPRL